MARVVHSHSMKKRRKKDSEAFLEIMYPSSNQALIQNSNLKKQVLCSKQ